MATSLIMPYQTVAKLNQGKDGQNYG